MKLTEELISYIENVVKTAKSVNIESVIIEPNMVRAIDEARTVVLFQNENVPEMPFGSIGLNRIDVFLSRLIIAKSQDDFTIDVVVDDDDDFARSLIMKGTKTKVDYRCANPSIIQAPRQINDNLVYKIELNSDAVSLLQAGQGAMGSEHVTISFGDDGVSFELKDINNDVLKHTFADNAEILSEDVEESFSHRYPIKTLLALFKQNPDGYFEIGEKGILNIEVNDLNIFVLPQV